MDTIGFLALGALIIGLIILSSMWLKPLHIPHGTRGKSAHTDQTTVELSSVLLFIAAVGFGIGLLIATTHTSLLQGSIVALAAVSLLSWLILPRQLWIPGAISFTVTLGYAVAMIHHDLQTAAIFVGTFLTVCFAATTALGPLMLLTKKQ